MNAATQRFIPRQRAPLPLKVPMIWGFYLNLDDATIFFWCDHEKTVRLEHEGQVICNGDKVSEVMKKPESHLSAIGSREAHEVIRLGGS
jgi:hypothetical protein